MSNRRRPRTLPLEVSEQTVRNEWASAYATCALCAVMTDPKGIPCDLCDHAQAVVLVGLDIALPSHVHVCDPCADALASDPAYAVGLTGSISRH